MRRWRPTSDRYHVSAADIGSADPGAGRGTVARATATPLRQALGLARAKKITVVGWREWVALPTLGIGAIKAKIDTGARTSALHAYDVRFLWQEGVEMVRFRVHPLQKDSRTFIEAEAPLKERRRVRSSSGHSSLRPVVVVPVEIGGRRLRIELTLTNRDTMGFRMLLGRRAIRRGFLVDAGKSYLTATGPLLEPPGPPLLPPWKDKP